MEKILVLVLFMVASTNAAGLGCNAPRSCADLFAAGFRTSGEFMIDPDGKDNGQEAFLVKCDLQKGVTIVHHDHEMRAKVPGPGDDVPVDVPITYTPSIDQIAGLADISDECEQALSYKCTNSAIYNGDDQMTYWMNRDEKKMSNWGGASSGVTGCACMDDNECDGHGRCACNGKGVAKDGGNLNDKKELPVTALHFEDLGKGKSGKYTLGPLMCKGGATNTEPSVPQVKETPGDGEYNCRLPSIKGAQRFEFEVRADSGGVRLALRSEENSAEMIEVAIDVLDENGNLATQIRGAAGGDPIDLESGSVPNPGNNPRLEPNFFNMFWLSFVDNMIEMGQMNEESQGKAFISVQIPEDRDWPPNFVCYTTDDDQPGYWKFPSFGAEEILKCENEMVNIDCGDKFINIEDAIYGRTDGSTCNKEGKPMKNKDCRADTSMPIVSNMCQAKHSCNVEASNGGFGDPCGFETSKYLKVKYRCVKTPETKVVATGPCSEDPCAKGSTCVPKGKGFECLCENGQTGETCAEGEMTCKASGDPHYTDFNDRKFDFQGDCTYVLARPAMTNPAWEVHAYNKPPDGKKKKVTRTNEVYVIIGEQKITLLQSNDVLLDGEEIITPFEAPDEEFEITREGKVVVVESDDHKFSVKWDGKSKVEVIVSANPWAGNLEGLCGPNDGNTNDEYVTSTKKKVPKSQIDQFGTSWGVGTVCQGKPAGSAKCIPGSPQEEKAKTRCAALRAETDGPFARRLRIEAQNTKNSKDIESKYAACEFDVCITLTNDPIPQDTDDSEMYRCKATSDMAEFIADVAGKDFSPDELGGWQEELGCPSDKRCDMHQTWSERVNPCAEVCGGLSKKQLKKCDKRIGRTKPGCDCDEGFVFQDRKCVKPEECGCRKEGKARKVGDVFFTKNCKERCTCNAGASLKCNKADKDERKECKNSKNPGKKAGSGSNKSEKPGKKAGSGSNKSEKPGKKAGSGSNKSEKPGKKAGSGSDKSDKPGKKAGSGSNKSEKPGKKAGSGSNKSEKPGKKAGSGSDKSEKPGKKAGSGSDKSEKPGKKAGSGSNKSEKPGKKAGSGSNKSEKPGKKAGSGSNKSEKPGKKAGSGSNKSNKPGMKAAGSGSNKSNKPGSGSNKSNKSGGKS